MNLGSAMFGVVMEGSGETSSLSLEVDLSSYSESSAGLGLDWCSVMGCSLSWELLWCMCLKKGLGYYIGFGAC